MCFSLKVIIIDVVFFPPAIANHHFLRTCFSHQDQLTFSFFMYDPRLIFFFCRFKYLIKKGGKSFAIAEERRRDV